ncbi:hypothetical protein [Bradyrhizobium sp. Bra64]|uniref:hypothetical protein n=1 Tax=Bradyrhizobium sp. Bra64 TaxID=2926009 RepID=UPI0021186622|nr:hypothetical protein [Bradyrhizobium sp. Bra64]
MSDELDDLFGPVIPPQSGLKTWELRETLKNYELNQDSAQQLTQILVLAQNMSIGQSIFRAITFIWVVDERGDIMFALEEVVDLHGTARRPRMRGIPLNNNVKPLGHPLLVGGVGARIGGELYLDEVSNGSLTWILDNKSGRYGTHKTRTTTHLENAAALFRRHRVSVDTDYIGVR